MKRRILSILAAAVLCVSLMPLRAQAASNPFTDVSSSAWYYADVLTAVDSGLVNGKTSSTYCPDDCLTCDKPDGDGQTAVKSEAGDMTEEVTEKLSEEDKQD